MTRDNHIVISLLCMAFGSLFAWGPGGAAFSIGLWLALTLLADEIRAKK